MQTAAALRRLLTVDDEAPIRNVLDEYFAGQGYAVVTASDGETALAAARRRRPDLVSAAMLHLGGSAHDLEAEGPADSDDPWCCLARTVFRAVRGMGERASGSTGRRMETAALAAARHAPTGDMGAAARELAELRLLVGIAGELGDLGGPERAAVETVLDDAHRMLRSSG